MTRPYTSTAQADWDDHHRHTHTHENGGEGATPTPTQQPPTLALDSPVLAARCTSPRCAWTGPAVHCNFGLGASRFLPTPADACPRFCPACGALAQITPAPAPAPAIPSPPFPDALARAEAFAISLQTRGVKFTAFDPPRRPYHLTPFQANLIISALLHMEDVSPLWGADARRLATVFQAINHIDSEASDH